MDTKALTPKQKRIFEFIRKYTKKYGYAPIYSEIGKKIGLSSSATIFNHIKALEKKGYIKRKKGVTRGIEILIEDKKGTDNIVRIALLGFIDGINPLKEYKGGEKKIAFLRENAKKANIDACFVLQVKGNNLVSEGLIDGDYLLIEYKEKINTSDFALVTLDSGIGTIRKVSYQARSVILESATDYRKARKYKSANIQGRLILVLRTL